METANVAMRFSAKNEANSNLIDLTRECMDKDNAEFFSLVANRLQQLDESGFNLQNGRTFKNGLRAAIGLIGEYGLIGYTIRQAQSIIRVDKGPSYWSHSFLFYDSVPKDASLIRSKSQGSPMIWESTIDFHSETPQLNIVNGVSNRYLSDYCKPDFDIFSMHCVPNAAAIIFALSDDEVEQILNRATDPNVDQLKYDFSGLIGTWLAYLFNKQNEENPLGAGNALYCSAYCQLAFDAVKIDLATGAHARNTSPENIWQGAKKLYDDYGRVGYPVIGFYCLRDPYCQMIPSEVSDESKFTTSQKDAYDRIRIKNA